MNFVYENEDWLYAPKKYVGELARFLRAPIYHSVQESGILSMVHDPISDLYDSWYNSPWDERKYTQYLMMKQIPGVNWNINVYEGKRDNDQYLSRNQMDWSDVKNPDRLPGSGKISAGLGGYYHYVSDNVRRLYR